MAKCWTLYILAAIYVALLPSPSHSCSLKTAIHVLCLKTAMWCEAELKTQWSIYNIIN